jgi:putative peptide zinc metalloprotease protein
MSGAIYSDAWYRIAEARVSLLPGVRTSRQSYRGQPWVVLEDAYSHRFFRITPEAHDFLLTLHQGVTVDQAWQAYLRQHPQHAPGQEEVVQLLSQLHVSNLLHFSEGANSIEIDRRAREVRGKELRSKLLSFLYFRIPIWDPDDFLTALDRRLRLLPAWLLVAVWLAVGFAGASAVIGEWARVSDRSQGAFAWANLPWLYLCMAVMKVVHEICHGLVCKRYGGKVHTFGLMFLVTTPLPYVDTTASWAFPDKRHRMLVSSAGMLADLFMAALGALVWAATGPGLVNSLAFNVMLIGSVSSVLFNGNPLLRFDAYYVLADALDIPNFYQKSQQYWFFLADRYLLGSHAARAPVDVPSERKWLAIYTPVSLVYRLLVSYAIVLFVMDLWLSLGLVMLVLTLYMLVVAPAWKAILHLFGPQVQAHRWRAWAGAGAMLGLVALVVFGVPWPHAIQAQGVVQMSRFSVLYAPLDARLERAVLGHGQTVVAGTPLMWFDPTLLSLDIEQIERERDEIVALERAALARQLADRQPLAEQRLVKEQRLLELKRRRDNAIVRAPHDGRYVALEGGERQGTWLGQGTEVGHVLDPSKGYQFVAVISQESARELFATPAQEASLRLLGQADQAIAVERMVLLPYQMERLPSAALGWLGGGDLAVSTQDAKGEKAAEEFFEVRLTLKPDPEAPLVLAHGMRGVLRLSMPARSLYARINESLRQLVQKRYRLG